MAAAPGSNAPETASPSGLDLLPPEIIVKVLPHLDVQSVARYSQVNRRANKIVKEAPNHQPFWDRAQEVVCNQRESRRLSFEFGNWPLCMIDPISVAGWNYAEASHNLVKNVMGPCQKCGDRPTWLSALDGRYVCWDCFYVATLVASLNYIWVPTIFRTDTINRYDFGDFGVIVSTPIWRSPYV
ncbi:hypothetical protein F5B20DRAFT_522137 [Whalleya microplaca]|nr:hypothetical protein F5B20DRAFT_522137 [Whalleya microplaca]